MVCVFAESHLEREKAKCVANNVLDNDRKKYNHKQIIAPSNFIQLMHSICGYCNVIGYILLSY
jgi:hypothetical protein